MQNLVSRLAAGIAPKFHYIALSDRFLDAGALPSLRDCDGISTAAVAASIKGWL